MLNVSGGVNEVRTWWCHEMETFSVLMAICAGNSLVTGEFPTQRPVTRSFDVFFDLCLNKRLSKPLWGWWFKMPSRPLWRHCNGEHEVNTRITIAHTHCHPRLPPLVHFQWRICNLQQSLVTICFCKVEPEWRKFNTKREIQSRATIQLISMIPGASFTNKD